MSWFWDGQRYTQTQTHDHADLEQGSTSGPGLNGFPNTFTSGTDEDGLNEPGSSQGHPYETNGEGYQSTQPPAFHEVPEPPPSFYFGNPSTTRPTTNRPPNPTLQSFHKPVSDNASAAIDHWTHFADPLRIGSSPPPNIHESMSALAGPTLTAAQIDAFLNDSVHYERHLADQTRLVAKSGIINLITRLIGLSLTAVSVVLMIKNETLGVVPFVICFGTAFVFIVLSVVFAKKAVRAAAKMRGLYVVFLATFGALLRSGYGSAEEASKIDRDGRFGAVKRAFVETADIQGKKSDVNAGLMLMIRYHGPGRGQVQRLFSYV